MKKSFGNKLSTEEALDATGREWEMMSIPGRQNNKRYEVKIHAYFERSVPFVGVGSTFEEAAAKALRNAGLVKRDRWPTNRHGPEIRPVWTIGLAVGHR